MVLRLAQHTADGMRQAHDKIRRDGRYANGTPNAIGSKVFSGHGSYSFWID
jgi:hypothetical protein